MRMLILALLSMIACASAPRSASQEELDDAVKYFEALYEINVPVPVKPALLGVHIQGSAVGCSTYGIQISDIFLMVADKEAVQETVFHELGHCILGRQHTDGRDVFLSGPMKGCVTSVMATHPDFKSYDDCWKRFKPYYVKELARPGLCLKSHAYMHNCDIHFHSNPKYFISE